MQKVTYGSGVLDDDASGDGLTLGELEEGLEMTRFGAMKHLRILAQAHLITRRRAGRNEHHYLNVVPIRLLHDRWIDKYTERQVSALTDLEAERARRSWPA